MNDPQEKPLFYATAPISRAVVSPDIEDGQMNGFAFSMDFGIVVALNREGDPSSDMLRKLKNMPREAG